MEGPLVAPETLVRLLDLSVDAIVVVDEDGRIVHFNRGASATFGYEPGEALGQPLEILLPRAAQTAHPHQMREFADSRDTTRLMAHRGRVSGVRRNGEEFPAEASIVRLAHEGRTYLAAVLRDVTEQAREDANRRFLITAGEALASSLDAHETMRRLEAVAVPALGDACVVDLANSPRAQVALAHANVPLDAHDTAFHALAGAYELDGARAAMAIRLETHGRVLGVMTCFARTRAYTAGDVELAAHVAGRAALALVNANLYEAAQRASRSRDEVLAVVSHDLRNPLSTIAMCASALADPLPPSTADVRSMADIIRQSSDWAQRIIRDLLDVTSLEAGRLSLRREPVDPGSIVTASVALFATQAAAAGVHLRTHAEADLPNIDADAERLLQVIFNLLGNALKFTSRDGSVTIDVSCEDPADAVRFRVTDTGAGIPAEHLPHLFDRYWQLRRTHRGGAGLGLAIAKGIVQAHGGTIAVTSTPGEGSVFAFTIPVTASA
ncbi:MAG: ATP-binding protein [Gemmatimonadaceae bacterium]